jgi:hypothetical protein
VPDIPPYATWDADRLLREGISPVLALEARIASCEEWSRRNEAQHLYDLARIDRFEARAYRDALAIITASQRLSDIDAVANQSKP